MVSKQFFYISKIVNRFYRKYKGKLVRCVTVSKELSKILTSEGIKNTFVWKLAGWENKYIDSRKMRMIWQEHAWIELKIGKRDYVIDITGPTQFKWLGIDRPIMGKKTYYNKWDRIKKYNPKNDRPVK